MKKKLFVYFISFCLLALTSGFQFVGAIVNEHPTWMVAFMSFPFCLFVIISCIIGLDLLRTDLISVTGHFTKKSAQLFQVQTAAGVMQSFRADSKLIAAIADGEQITVTFYRRTKSVTDISVLNS